jgi:hypothetical protein
LIMPTHDQPRFRFQFSLRTLIIVISVLGVGSGIMGRLFIDNPETFLTILRVFSYVGPFVLAIITIFWLGFRPKPAWLTPLCGACKHDLGSAKLNRPANCPQCGASLAEPDAVLFPRWPVRRWGVIIWGILLVLMPFMCYAGLFVAQRFVGSSPSDLQYQSTQRLLQKHLPKQIDAPWVWQELERRVNSQSMSQQEADDAVKQLTAFVTSRPGSPRQPLHYQSNFLKSAVQRGMVSDATLIALCDAFFGSKPSIQTLPRLREGRASLPISIEYGNPFGQLGPGVVLLWQVKRLLIDGKTIKPQRNSRFSNHWNGFVDGITLTAGDHELVAELECAYIDATKLAGPNTEELPVKSWPKARKQWQQSVSATLNVLPVGRPVVALVTDSSRDPGPSGGVQVIALFAQAEPNGRKKIVLKIAFSETLGVPLSYDVSAKLGGQTVKLGQTWIRRSANAVASGGSELQALVDRLDDKVKSADIILTPNPAHVEERPEVNEIWGKPTTLHDVELDRLDLEE